MKKVLLLIVIFLATIPLYSQNVGISDDGSSFTPEASAVLELKSTSKGVLVPRMTTAQRGNISSPADGLLVYDTDTESFWYYDNSSWIEIISSQVASLEVGDGTNQMSVESDGTVEFQGTATTFEDLRVPVLSTVKSTSNPPDDIQILGNLVTFGFDKGKTEEVFFVAQLPHSYKTGSDIFAHVHWLPTTADNTGQVVWVLEYSWASHDQVFPSTSTLSSYTTVGTDDATAYEHRITDFGSIDGTGKTISSMLICRLYRDGGDSNDTYNADAALLEIDFHYEVNTLGSRQEYVK